ncbi:MAG: hypothetical protein EPN88_06145 [Bacteroidetes bacterium]|nr:MAG: hypothetical protein EPN88_06145 [Bacteroidota bacterium]
MKISKLKKTLIRLISEIDDVTFLKEIEAIIDSWPDQGIIQLTQAELDEIKASKTDIEQGKYIENKILEKEVKQWLKLR